MTIKYFQKVLLPVTVSVGDYCWGPHPTENHVVICPHFDNEGGHPTCDLTFNLPVYGGYTKKPDECKNLKIVE